MAVIDVVGTGALIGIDQPRDEGALARIGCGIGAGLADDPSGIGLYRNIPLPLASGGIIVSSRKGPAEIHLCIVVVSPLQPHLHRGLAAASHQNRLGQISPCSYLHAIPFWQEEIT